MKFVEQRFSIAISVQFLPISNVLHRPRNILYKIFIQLRILFSFFHTLRHKVRASYKLRVSRGVNEKVNRTRSALNALKEILALQPLRVDAEISQRIFPTGQTAHIPMCRSRKLRYTEFYGSGVLPFDTTTSYDRLLTPPSPPPPILYNYR